MQGPNEVQEPVKDGKSPHPVPTVWRSSLREVVRAFVKGDYTLSEGVRFVEPVPESTAKHVKDYIADYGEALVELPEESWNTSFYQWYGSHWDVFVDLWTEAGKSDMVLSAQVYETENGAYRIVIHMVYVP